MLGIVGGCGSSGTTLLAHLLSRSPLICSGPEFNCFNHGELYDFATFRRFRDRMLEDRCPPVGYVDVYVFMTFREHYGIEPDRVRAWVDDSEDTWTFLEKLRQHMVERFGAPNFVEKTPTNVYCFPQLLALNDSVRVVHLVRDGRDVSVSLMKRGFNLFGAGSRWLYDTLAGLRGRGSDNYLEVRYEDLVTDSEGTLSSILRHLGVEEGENLLTETSDESPGLYSEDWKDRQEPRVWGQTPGDPISTKSVGRFRTALSRDDLSTLDRIRLTDRAVSWLDPKVRTFGELLEYLGYSSYEDAEAAHPTIGRRIRDRTLEIQDYLRRLKRLMNRTDKSVPVRFTRAGRV